MKIYYVSVYLTKDGLKEKKQVFDCEESKSTFIIEKESGFGGKTTRLSKDKILIIESMVRENLYYVLHFFTWCFESQIDEAIKLLNERLFAQAKSQYETSKKIFEHLSKEFAKSI